MPGNGRALGREKPMGEKEIQRMFDIKHHYKQQSRTRLGVVYSRLLNIVVTKSRQEKKQKTTSEKNTQPVKQELEKKNV